MDGVRNVGGENDDDMETVEKRDDVWEQTLVLTKLKKERKQGTIKHYLSNSGFLESPSTSTNGGGENDRGGGATEATASQMDPIRMKSGPRGKNFWTEKAAKSKIKGAKSKNGKRKKTWSDSSQWEVPGMKLYFSAIKRPKEEANSHGNT